MAKLTPQACKAARALLDWSIRDLADHAGVGVSSIQRMESGENVRESVIDKIKLAFLAHDVEITNGDGTGAKLIYPK